MRSFQDYVYRHMAEHMRSWPKEVAHDICLIACLINFDEDDARHGRVALSCTTPGFWASRFPEAPSDPNEKWYHVLETPLPILTLCDAGDLQFEGDDPGDVEGVALRVAYYQTLGLFVSDEENAQWHPLETKWRHAQQGQEALTAEEEDRLASLQQRLAALPETFVDVCAESIRQLHTDGTIVEVCGKPVPVIFCFGNGGDDKHLMQRMREVNPPGLTDEYYYWYKEHQSGEEDWP